MTDTTSDPDILPHGIDGVLVRFSLKLTEEANERAIAFRDLVTEAALPGVTEVASSLTSVRVAFDHQITDRTKVTQAVNALLLRQKTARHTTKRLWRIPVAFSPNHAPQLAEAARLADLTPAQAVEEITEQIVKVMAIGFAPGQPYLGLLTANWDVPRQTTLTERVPNGALVAAVRQLIIFSADAPTGWRHIGQTAFRVYRPEAAEPFALTPGDAVQFRPVTDEEFAAIQKDRTANGGASFEVLK